MDIEEHKRELIAAMTDQHRADAAVTAPDLVMRITWRAIGNGPAHAQPATDGHRRHFCQGMKARSMTDPAGARPSLRTPRELRALARIEHAKDAPVCAGCISALHWLFGDPAFEVVNQYRAMRRAAGQGAEITGPNRTAARGRNEKCGFPGSGQKQECRVIPETYGS